MLFDRISENFFLPLAGVNRKVYWECIFKLYTIMSSQLSFGVLKEVVVDELQAYFEGTYPMDLQDENEIFKSARDKATYTYRKLLECGWLTREETTSYEERISFNDYAIELIQTLHHIEENDKMEYQAYVYTIYTLVKSKSPEKGILLNQVYENTERLITGLKSLNANIKKYIDQLTKYESIAEIMQVLFEDYRVNIVDKAYHRLKTSDNVSKFRPVIVEWLEQFMKDEFFIARATEDIARMKEIEDESAREKVYDMLQSIRDAFLNMDGIIEEIDAKNSSYQRAAINRAKFMLSYGEDVSGQIKEILVYMGEQMVTEEVALNTIYTIEYTEQLFTLYASNFLDEESLYKPIEGKKVFKPEPLQETPINEEGRQEKMRFMAQKLQNTMSPQHIQQYVDRILGDKQVMLASTFPIETPEDFMKIIYMRLYGQRRRIQNKIVPKERIKKLGYEFTDFEVWGRKK